MILRQSPRQQGGVALIEVVIALGVIGLAASILALCSNDSQRRSRLAGSIENLQQFADGYASFAKDNADRVATFSWRAGINYGFGGVASTDLQAAANQAIDIIRRRGNRSDLQVINSWLPHLLYNHLVLVDYLGQEIPSKWVVSPGDSARLAWQRDPQNFDLLPSSNRPSGASGPTGARWPYSSSYEIPPAFFSPDQVVGAQQTIYQAQAHNLYFIPGGNGWLGNRLLSEVAFPSQKAMTYESVQRFFGPRQAFFAYPEARVPVMTADGSVGVRTTDFTNRGFQPNSPTLPFPTSFQYMPDTNWEPSTLSGAPADVVNGYMRWCRRGLAGRDFDGPEAP